MSFIKSSSETFLSEFTIITYVNLGPLQQYFLYHELIASLVIQVFLCFYKCDNGLLGILSCKDPRIVILTSCTFLKCAVIKPSLVPTKNT